MDQARLWRVNFPVAVPMYVKTAFFKKVSKGERSPLVTGLLCDYLQIPKPDDRHLFKCKFCGSLFHGRMGKFVKCRKCKRRNVAEVAEVN
jgi:hypothetical protein